MERFDHDTGMMRVRRALLQIDLRMPEPGSHDKSRGIAVGAALGAMAWAAIVALGVAAWKGITG